MTKAETEKLVNYLSALEYLYHADRNAVKSILTVYNFEHESDHKALRSFQQFAVMMIKEEGVLNEVLEESKKLILNKAVHAEFIKRLKS